MITERWQPADPIRAALPDLLAHAADTTGRLSPLTPTGWRLLARACAGQAREGRPLPCDPLPRGGWDRYPVARP